MSDAILISELRPRGFLSFGPDTEPIKLGPLNVLIGPNGSGKSNLIEAICFLRSAPISLEDFLRKGGGVREWIWKGEGNESASVSAVVTTPAAPIQRAHLLNFRPEGQLFQLTDESVKTVQAIGESERYSYHLLGSKPSIKLKQFTKIGSGEWVTMRAGTVDTNASILSQRQDPDQYPEITHLANQYRAIRTYREWSFGRTASIRMPQAADMRSDKLEEDFSNLGLFLNSLRRNSAAKRAIQKSLTDLYAGITDFDVSILGGTVQVFLEEGEFQIPATRLSDGTLRYLCLLAILLDPTPPPLICIEEPELGLHPDIISKLAKLMIDASKHTQLVVTTHSDLLIDALSEQPDSVLVCEKHDGKTLIQRLDAEHLKPWLKDYGLGQLWLKGEIGGTRW
ncbi:MAG: AAA family ATPase [Capsulimonadaceae bacterium]|nr:AAA family ATPase [Capsulimonadaceae bacterium]